MKPCPFCGSTELDVRVQELSGSYEMEAQMYCEGCQAEGPRVVMDLDRGQNYAISRAKDFWDVRHEP